MSKGNTFENELLLHIFQNADIADIGDAAGLQNSAAAGSLYVSLHTADPGEGGNQTTSEATYTGYARVAVARSAGGWTVTANLVQNAAAVTFGLCTAGSNTITHWAVGTASSGTGKILYKGTIGTVIQGPFTATDAGDLFTCPGHTFANDERVAFYPAFGSSLPTGITEGTVYWIIGVSGNTFQVSTTQAGAAVTITADGDGVAVEAATLAVSSGITPEFAINAINITED